MGVRRVVAGEDAAGRSHLRADGPPPTHYRFAGARPEIVHPTGDASPPDADELLIGQLWQTGGAEAAEFTQALPEHGTRWRIVTFGPHRATPMHTTATVDYDLVLDGEITLILDDGEVALGAGDAVVVPGVSHGWRTGEQACAMSVVMVALER